MCEAEFNLVWRSDSCAIIFPSSPEQASFCDANGGHKVCLGEKGTVLNIGGCRTRVMESWKKMGPAAGRTFASLYIGSKETKGEESFRERAV